MTTEPIETETDDEEDLATCDHCGDVISQAAYDAGDGLCAGCVATTFLCEDCSDRTYTEDAHKTHSTLCESCGDTKDEEIAQERLDAAKEAAQEAFDAILDSDDLAVIAKALAALKRLQPK
jgi:hypothetical protein